MSPDSEYRLREKGVSKNYGSSLISGKGRSKYRVSYSWDRALRRDSDDEDEDVVIEGNDGFNNDQVKVRNTIAKMDPKLINFDLISYIIRFIIEENPAKVESLNAGSVLVFLPGLWEISKCAEILNQDFLVKGHSPLLILPLHSGLSNQEQSLVFKQSPVGKLKVVLSTNVAETGVTIPDAVYVIDSVRAREITFDQKRGITRLVDIFISKANVKQRMGRSGRIRPGISFHLVPLETFEKLPDDQKPEMVRLPLEEVCLKMAQMDLDIGSLSETFQALIDPPPVQNVDKAILSLKRIKALNEEELITNLGKLLGQIPLDVRVGKILVFGLFLGALDPILTCCALLSLGKSPFLFPPGKVEEVKLAHARFYNGYFGLIGREI
jgi:ATP-dependent RNA helicase DHX29